MFVKSTLQQPTSPRHHRMSTRVDRIRNSRQIAKLPQEPRSDAATVDPRSTTTWDAGRDRLARSVAATDTRPTTACSSVATAVNCMTWASPSVVQPHQACWNVTWQRGEDVKLGRSPGWHLVRAERSELYIFTYIERWPGQKVNTPTDAIGNTCELKSTSAVASLRRINEFSRSEMMMELDLLPGELRGYWKYHAPGK
ncbi:unnamed protein product [Phytophthora fragariaefolia]|uniref:Unnamed protein product n=1 Tax=Phytophthora fragariaefolia TaxID=1490495 RepID=A0A9W6X9V3_9STRA|nr:unnamed protein product [Phytophthora fragariaefolia]